jgi:hypothetical protein
MDVAAAERARPRTRDRLAAVGCGCLLAGAAVYTAMNEPGAAGSRFLPCAFHRTTGLWCPGCGLTRGAHALFTGHPLEALGYNLFTPLALVGIVVAWGTWALRCWGRQVRDPIARIPARWGRVLLVAVLVFGVARNLPFDPFRSLAP